MYTYFFLPFSFLSFLSKTTLFFPFLFAPSYCTFSQSSGSQWPFTRGWVLTQDSSAKPQNLNWWRWPCASLSLFITSTVAGWARVLLIATARPPSAITTRTLWNNESLFHTDPENYTAHLGPHSEVTRRESTQASGSALSGVGGKGIGFGGLTLYWWIENIRVGI